MNILLSEEFRVCMTEPQLLSNIRRDIFLRFRNR